MTSQNDRPDESLTGQALDQAGHCPLTGRYFEPWCSHIKSIATLISNKTNCNRTEFASLFRSPQAGLWLAIAVIYKIYGVKKLFLERLDRVQRKSVLQPAFGQAVASVY